MRINELKGIGDKTEKLFNKLNVYTTEDLIHFYPRTYDVYEEPVKVSEMTDTKTYAIWGTVVSLCELVNAGRYRILSVYVADDDGARIKLTWFNMPFLKNNLKRGYRYIFRGEAAFRGSLVFMEQPVMYSYDAYMQKMNTMQPVYRLTAGLTNNAVTKAVKQCLDIFHTEEYLPEDVINDTGVTGLGKAMHDIHFPENMDSFAAARKRLAFDEFFIFTLAMRSLSRGTHDGETGYIIPGSPYSEQILKNLGYKLTNAQQKVYSEILNDMSGHKIMNRLIQGDVGSGKTIIALLAMIDAAYSGYQSALMAPTEVLATQHYETFSHIIETNNLPVKCILMTGAMTAAAKREAHRMAAEGEADIVIGTHAVITDNVSFDRLALVVTDEQHRFGVKQREALHHKGNKPHIIVMSATPIPRSLAIILYGDLDISVIDEKPAMRLPIKNCVVDDSYRPNAYRFIQKELDKGHQAYIICPMAKESDEEDNKLENVVEYAAGLKEKFPPHVRIEYLHGKLKPSVKNDIMERFAQGEIDILVSTTVVEVGINVPNATVMVVENAERFGLAGLHQLRGRVGRGDAQSYCIFISNTRNTLTKERLNILKESNDGFYISEQDLKLRGPGDMLGVRQSGDFGFMIADIYTDAATLKLAADEADKVMERFRSDDPEYDKLRHAADDYMRTRLDNLNI
ncbi:MAG: ATP-dependent DNA helicase RecG [Lachnospiraceae bacterium]|nr:ATP-dependent DNA helicase RecG [Lachnospiraceae bacterium]